MIEITKEEYKRLKKLEKLILEEIEAKDNINENVKKLRKIQKEKRDLNQNL